jgi:prophage regulatory protein
MTKTKTISIAKAKALAARWEAEQGEHTRTSAIASRFKDAAPAELVRMFESGANDQGRKLSQVEFMALVERWLEVFGAYPSGQGDETPDDSVALYVTQAEELEPLDDTMLSPRDVARMTGISTRNIRRMFESGRFPRPLKLSTRRIGWPARQVKDWLRTLQDQSRSTRQ